VAGVADLIQARSYIARDNPEAAAEVAARIRAAVQILIDCPPRDVAVHKNGRLAEYSHHILNIPN
jgi:plasmid stabilization system protein ParE